MVLVKIFGVFDILAGIILILLKFGTGMYIGWFFAIYLIVKSLIFIKDISSVIDIVAAVFLILALYNIYPYFTFIFVVWLLQKGFFSLVS